MDVERILDGIDFDSEPETDTSTSSSPEEEEALWKTNSYIQAKESKSMSTDTNTVMKVQIKRSYGKKFKVRKTGHLIGLFKRSGIKQDLSYVEYNDLKNTAYLISPLLWTRSVRFTGYFSCINKPWQLDAIGGALPTIEAEHYVPWCSASRLRVKGRVVGHMTNKRIPVVHVDGHGAPRRGEGLTLRAHKLHLIGGVGLEQTFSCLTNVQLEASPANVEIEVAVKNTWFSPKDSDCTSWRVREGIYTKSRSDPAFLFENWAGKHKEFANMEVEFKQSVRYWGLHVTEVSQKQVDCVETLYDQVMERIHTRANDESVSLEGVECEWKSDMEGARVAVSFGDCENSVALMEVLYPMAEIYDTLATIDIFQYS